jgi:hypothetical protein
MALTATGYKIHNDKVTLDSVYINVRDLSTNKESSPDISVSGSSYVFSCHIRRYKSRHNKNSYSPR